MPRLNIFAVICSSLDNINSLADLFIPLYVHEGVVYEKHLTYINSPVVAVRFLGKILELSMFTNEKQQHQVAATTFSSIDIIMMLWI